jgi:hypothetical protein
MTDNDLEHRIRNARVRSLMSAIGWKGALTIGLIAAGIAAVVWLQTTMSGASKQLVEYVYGTTESAFVPQTDRAGAATRITVTLDDNQKVALQLPRGAAYIPEARVKIAVHAREGNGARWLEYQFVEYDESSS